MTAFSLAASTSAMSTSRHMVVVIVIVIVMVMVSTHDTAPVEMLKMSGSSHEPDIITHYRWST